MADKITPGVQNLSPQLLLASLGSEVPLIYGMLQGRRHTLLHIIAWIHWGVALLDEEQELVSRSEHSN